MKWKTNRWFCIIQLVLLILTPMAWADATPDARAILEKIDRLFRADSSEAEITMRITTPDWSRDLKIRSWSKGMKKTFIRILAPKKDEGVATLRVGHEMWNYFPKINKVIKIPPSMMMGSWMGSDFTNDDLVRESSLVEDYDVTMKVTETSYLLTLVPKASTPTVWGRIEAEVEKRTMLPVEQVYYDEKGVKIRRMRLSNIRDFGGRKIPSVMELVPLDKPGHSTRVSYERATFNKTVDDGVFTLRNLQKQ
ncbi:MAG: outer membrane lipoprotein-sorting protein [Syntrophales bacterium]|nr:outer membrane lipoprotein-sorting protein [Syntrophales bacterium]